MTSKYNEGNENKRHHFCDPQEQWRVTKLEKSYNRKEPIIFSKYEDMQACMYVRPKNSNQKRLDHSHYFQDEISSCFLSPPGLYPRACPDTQGREGSWKSSLSVASPSLHMPIFNDRVAHDDEVTGKQLGMYTQVNRHFWLVFSCDKFSQPCTIPSYFRLREASPP